MDPRLVQAAKSGNIDELYVLIDENPYILDSFDAVPFVNTPLHVAAAAGNEQFAMEMLNLKPSFARKLNTSGNSPLHLAVENDQTDIVVKMLWLDHSLAGVRGKNGITPFLSLVLRGNTDLVAECLLTSPECIKDVNMKYQNALHLAVMNDRFDVLQVLTGWIQRMSQRNADSIEISFLNKRDFEYNTALHLAAYKSDDQAVKLLLECGLVDRNKVNRAGSTFLDILRNQGQRTVGGELRSQGQRAATAGGELRRQGQNASDLEQVVLETGCKEATTVPKFKATSEYLKSPITFVTSYSTSMRRIRSTSDEARGVFLIVCALIITATYQTALQPPGGIHQSGDANAGSVVMKQAFFILLWVFNTVGFSCAIFYTFCLIPLDSFFSIWFFWVGTSLCISYALAMAVISPHPLVFLSATVAFFLVIGLYLLVCFICWRTRLTVVSYICSFVLALKLLGKR